MYTFNSILSKLSSRHARLLCLVAVMGMIVGGCIENNVPYPRIQANFLSMEVENSIKPANIDTLSRKVTVYLNESADMKNVQVVSYTVTEGASLTGNSITGGIDLTSPLNVTLRLYQDYVWTISAEQDIERYFTLASQIGVSEIDVAAHRVIAYVPESSSLSQVMVQTMKLGGETSVMSPDLSGQTVDFSQPVTVGVTEFGRTEQWTIYVSHKTDVTTGRVDAWTCVAWLHGEAQAGSDNGFEYRLADAAEWRRVPAEWITHTGGNFTGRLIHLSPNTAYVARAYSGTAYGEEVEFTTSGTATIPNASFDVWSLSGKIWNPWGEGVEQCWDTGNKGATTLGDSNSVPTADTYNGMGQAAMLQTKFVGIASAGKLAAGNLFTGKYVKTDGTNGVLSFGHEFTERPTKIKGYLKYNMVPISHAPERYGYQDLKGRPDTCIVWAALADWETPYEIRTNPKNRQLFDENDPQVIAYGKVQFGESVLEYIPFELEFDYHTTQRIPRYIVIVASASKYGDFFTGGDGSVLYVDELSLEYDY